jgi:hypothetical protein
MAEMFQCRGDGGKVDEGERKVAMERTNEEITKEWKRG